MLPDYFFTVAASSTGKYHPRYALGKGGLVRHTQAAVKIAHELLQLEQNNSFTDKEKDLILTAIMLHDGWKHGNEYSNFTVAEHPVVCADWIKETIDLHKYLTEEELDIICSGIASHMGQWNTKFRSKVEIMPKPETEIQKFIHMCDYLASRKWLIIEFEDYYDGSYKAESQTEKIISKIVTACKEKIESGVTRDTIYSIIKEVSGVRNPNKITEQTVANKVLEKIKELSV